MNVVIIQNNSLLYTNVCWQFPVWIRITKLYDSFMDTARLSANANLGPTEYSCYSIRVMYTNEFVQPFLSSTFYYY